MDCFITLVLTSKGNGKWKVENWLLHVNSPLPSHFVRIHHGRVLNFNLLNLQIVNSGK